MTSGQKSEHSAKNAVVEEQDQVLIIYPNPSNGNAKIDIPGAENIQVKVYDLQGRLVLDSQSQRFKRKSRLGILSEWPLPAEDQSRW